MMSRDVGGRRVQSVFIVPLVKDEAKTLQYLRRPLEATRHSSQIPILTKLHSLVHTRDAGRHVDTEKQIV